MKQQEVFKKIGIIVRELNDQYEYLVANQSELNDLELELFVANAHFLADHSEVLRKLNLQNAPAPKTVHKHEVSFFEPIVQQAKPEGKIKPVSQINEEETPVPHIDLRGDDTGADYSYIRQPEPEPIRHQLTLDDVPGYDEQEQEQETVKDKMAEDEVKIEPAPVIEVVKEAEVQPVKEAPKPEPVLEAVKEEIVQPVKESPKVEDIQDEPLTINQRMSAQVNAKARRVTEHEQPVTDLKQAITLNDKLLYIKDLFNGYNLAYSEAIDILNRYNSMEEADKFLKTNYAVKNSWESKQHTVDKFYELLKRRYS